MEDDILRGPPSQEDGEDEQEDPGHDVARGAVARQVCVYSRGGVCCYHGPGTKMWKPKRTWVKGKDGLFKWKYGRVQYFTCTKQNRKDDDVSGVKPTLLMLRDSAGQMRNFTLHRRSGGSSGGNQTKPVAQSNSQTKQGWD